MKNPPAGLTSQQTQPEAPGWTITRRDFLKTSGLLIASISARTPLLHAAQTVHAPKLRFGIVTDVHYADAPARGTRYYAESLAKLAECVMRMDEHTVAFLVELGDFKDQADPPTEETTLSYLETIEQTFRRSRADTYHVLGNHDVDSLSKKQFLAITANPGIPRKSTFYSFDRNGFHCIVLDANYLADGSDYDTGNFDWTDTNMPQPELDWLDRDLASTSKPSIVFVHQQLDGEGSHYVNNAADVRLILQKHRRVLAVFQGHNHAGHYSHIEGIHYYTLKAMVEGSGEENSAYAIVEIDDDHGLVVTGFRRALSRRLPKA